MYKSHSPASTINGQCEDALEPEWFYQLHWCVYTCRAIFLHDFRQSLEKTDE
jgi:hypothetical protein